MSNQVKNRKTVRKQGENQVNRDDEACGNRCGRLTTCMQRAQKEIKHLKHRYEADTVTEMRQTDPHPTPTHTHTHTHWMGEEKNV